MDADAPRPDKLLILACESDALDPLHEALSLVTASLPPSSSSSDEAKDHAIAELVNRTTNPVGVPALHVAIQHGSLDVIEELAEYPINVGVLDRDKNSILHAAVLLTEKNFDVGDELTRLFLEAGTPISHKNKAGYTVGTLLEHIFQLHLPQVIAQYRSRIPDIAKFQHQSPAQIADTLRQLPEREREEDEVLRKVIGWADLIKAVARQAFSEQAMGDVVVEDDDDDGGAGSESD